MLKKWYTLNRETALDKIRRQYGLRPILKTDVYWNRFSSGIDRKQYKHPKWQRVRLLVFQRDDFKCTRCGETEKILHAHHLKYIEGAPIWDVPICDIITLCEDCHSQEHGKDLRI